MSSEAAAEPAPTAARSAKFIVFLVVFIDLLGFGIVLPLLPRFADQFLAGASDGTKGVVIGLLYSSFSIMQFAFAPMWGRLSDRIGRRPVLVIGLVGSVLFYGLFGYACGLPASSAELALTLLMLSRIGAGIAGANIGTAAAVIADCTTPEKRAKGMALIGAAFGIGFTFGPLIAYFGLELFQNNPGGPGFIAAGLSAIALGLAIGMLPETLPPGPKPPREGFGISRTIAVLKNPIVGPLILLYFLAIFAFANFEGTLSLFTKEAFQLTERDNFLVFAYIGFVLLVAQGGIYRPLVGRKKEAYMLKLGAGLMLLGLGGLIGCAYVTAAIRPQTIVTEEGIRLTMQAVTGLETQLKVLFYGAVTVAVVGFAFVNPSVSALVSRRAEPGRQGEIIGVNQSAAALGRIAGPFVGNVVFWLEPARMLPFVVGCVLTFGAIALLPRVTRTPPTP